MIETPDTTMSDNTQLDQSLSLSILNSSLKNSYANTSQNPDYNSARFFLQSSQEVKSDNGTGDYNSTPAFVQSYSDVKDQDNMIGIIDGENEVKPKLSIAELSGFVEYRDVNNTYKHSFMEMKNIELVGAVDRTDAKQLYIKYPALRELLLRAPKDCSFLIRIGCDFNAPVNLSTTEGYFAYTTKFSSTKCTVIRVTSKLYNCGSVLIDSTLEINDYGQADSNGIYNYNFNRIQLCDHITNLIRTLQIDLLNNAERLQTTLDNTGIMQVIRDRDSQEILLLLLLEFEINLGHYRVFKIT